MRGGLQRFGLYVLLLIGAFWPAAVPAQSVDVLPPSNRLVTDRAGLLTAAEVQALEQKLRAYADTTSTQIVVVTIPSLDGQDAGLYATELGQQWGVGQAGKDNGAVVLVARDDREVFIATGYGLEGAIPDAVAARIIREILTPNFRAGRFYVGLSEAADALIWAARGEFTADAAPPAYDGGGGEGFDPGLIFVVLIILYFVFTSFGRRGGGGGGGRRYRRHGGPPVIIWGGGGGGLGGGGFSGGGGFGGFGGGGFGGGGAGGGW